MKSGSYQITYIVVPGDVRVKAKEQEKIETYYDLAREVI